MLYLAVDGDWGTFAVFAEREDAEAYVAGRQAGNVIPVEPGWVYSQAPLEPGGYVRRPVSGGEEL